MSLLMGTLAKTFLKGIKLSPCVFFGMITDAPGPNEGHLCGIVFVHRRSECVYDSDPIAC